MKKIVSTADNTVLNVISKTSKIGRGKDETNQQ
jgi:hypothetical protein